MSEKPSDHPMTNWICSMDMGCPIDRAIDYNRELLRQAQEAEADLAALRETARALAAAVTPVVAAWRAMQAEPATETQAADQSTALAHALSNLSAVAVMGPAVRALLEETDG